MRTWVLTLILMILIGGVFFYWLSLEFAGIREIWNNIWGGPSLRERLEFLKEAFRSIF